MKRSGILLACYFLPALVMAAEQNDPYFYIDAKQSQAVITVYSGGSLAKLGHDHVIASHDMQGVVIDGDAGQQEAGICIPLALLVVDEPALRSEAHFKSQPSASDIAGTREHMLDSVLEVKQFPDAKIHVSQLRLLQSTNYVTTATLTLHGVSKTIEVPVILEKIGVNELKVTGEFSLKQTDYGMKPYSALGGLLKVKDEVNLKFSIIAVRKAQDK